VDMLVVTNPHPPLFRASISQSGTAAVVGRFLTPTGEAIGISFFSQVANGLGCDNSTTKSQYECIRNATSSDIIKVIESANGTISFQPGIDNVTAIADYGSIRQSGNVAPVPVLIGSNKDEGSVVLATSARGANLSSAVALYGGLLDKATVSRIINIYQPYLPVDTTSAEIEQVQYYAADKYFTDVQFQCPTAVQTVLHAEAGYPSWRYYYNATFPNTDLYPRSGAWHMSEIFQIFGNFPLKGVEPIPGTNVPPPTEEQRVFSAYMQKTWADYAKNPYNGPGWQGAGKRVVGVLALGGVKEVVASDLDGDRCSQITV
jgi:carboxylesterase type B